MGGRIRAGRDIIAAGRGSVITTGASTATGSDRPEAAPAACGGIGNSERSIFLAVDVVGYGRAVASEHGELQSDLRRVLVEAATGAHLPSGRWVVQPQGDGVLVRAPLESEPRYIDDFVAHVQANLRRRNRDRVPEARLRVRMGIDQGPASTSVNGFGGEAPILACRLRDAAATRRAIESSVADLVLAVSDQMFQDNVAQDQTRVTPAEFVRIEIDESKLRAVAWIWLPDGRAPQTVREARMVKDLPTRWSPPHG